jgi:flagellar biosynthesis/type III secretory pathway chaperone
MPTNSPREALLEILTAEVEQAGQMLEVLQLERKAVRGRDLPGIERAATEKERLATILEELSARQTVLMRAAGIAPQNLSSSQMAAGEEIEPLSRAWQDLIALLTECQQQNRVNGGVIAASQRFARDMLSALRGAPAASPVYGRSGHAHQADEGESLATA